jgi:dihydrolipoamide dehydrogenase
VTPSHRAPAEPAAQQPALSSGKPADIECAMVVLGAGPGGYTAAFRSADLGVDTVLIERYASLGGVCLNVGCIPSKALLHAAAVIDEVAHAGDFGVEFGAPTITLDKLRGYKEKVVTQLTKGLAGMAKQRKVRTVQGVATFVSANELEIVGDDGKTQLLRFEKCIIAAGSQAVKLPNFLGRQARDGFHRRAGAGRSAGLAAGGGRRHHRPGNGHGVRGTRQQGHGGRVHGPADAGRRQGPGQAAADRLKKQGVEVHLKTKASGVSADKKGITVTFEAAAEGEKPGLEQGTFDRVLVAVGRSPNGKKIGAEKAGVGVTERGFIPVDRQMRTNVPHIFAIGDIVGNPMLAHKATHEGKLAAEVASGEKKEWVARVIPSVAYTNPEIAWVGVTETEAKAQGLKVGVAKFPWAASGRAIGIGRTEGFTKLIFDEETHRIIGGAIVGVHAGDLLAEIGLAIEMGAEAEDIGHTIRPPDAERIGGDGRGNLRRHHHRSVHAQKKMTVGHDRWS